MNKQFFQGKSLPTFQCKLLSSVLQDGISQLNVLGNALPVPIKECKIKYIPPNKRYGDKVEKEPIAVRRNQSSTNLQILQKLQMERTLIEGILSGTLHEVVSKGSFVFLQCAVSYLENLIEDDENLVKMEKHNQEKLKKIQKVISEEKINSERTLEEKADQICKLQDEIIDEIEIEKVMKGFVRHWEKATQEQLLMKLANSTNSQNEKLKRLAKNLEDEESTSESVTNYLTLASEDLTEQIARWKEQYESDVGSIEKTIANLKASKEIQSKKYNDLEKEFSLRQGEMDEFLAAKAERQRREAKERLEFECAVRLQAWWRGLMVRRCLGQFRRRKKAAAAKESAKQKKKGKAKKK